MLITNRLKFILYISFLIVFCFSFSPYSYVGLSISNPTIEKQTVNSKSDFNYTIDGFVVDTSVSTLLINNKIPFVFVGALYSSYSAVETWALVHALSQFGNFTNLIYFSSSVGNISTYNFMNTSYASSLIDFQPADIYDNSAPPNQQPLQSLNSLQTNEFSKYGSNIIPFICIGGKIFRSGISSSFNIDSFYNQSFETIHDQIVLKSGTLYDQIIKESTQIYELITGLYNNNVSYVTTSITHYEGKVVFGQIDPISLTSILSFGTFVLALVLFLIIKNKKKKQS